MTALLPIDTAPRDFTPTPITDEEGAALFRAAINLFCLWSVTDEEAAILLDLPVRSYRRWKAGEIGRIDRDSKARLSNLIGIHKALRIVFRDPQRGYGWIRAPNSAFDGRTALEVMLGGELTDIMRVRRYLDGERGGW
jgi:hypothetical protein